MTRNQVKKPLIIQLVGWALILAPIGYYVTTALQWQNWSLVVLIEQLLALPHACRACHAHHAHHIAVHYLHKSHICRTILF